MQPERKLRRGLEDVSPLFRNEGGMPVPAVKPVDCDAGEVRSIGIIRTGGENRRRPGPFLAGVLEGRGYRVTVLTVPGTKGACTDTDYQRNVRHVALTGTRFDRVCSQPVPRREELQPARHLLILDAEAEGIPSVDRMFAAMDQCIVLMRPATESILEAYRIIKRAAAVNSGLEYFMLLEDDPRGRTGSFLFERFSDILSRQLGIGISWLGSLPGQAEEGAANAFSADALLQFHGIGSGAPEKYALARALTEPERQMLGQAS